ncbi:MAG TPA: murein L,D-transpeptidase catalytic domain family protein [Chitinophagaceae bacterium]|nr:murein L,D-transpeptidase catalytic domain family protein [Chitinophagaceae bacterium]
MKGQILSVLVSFIFFPNHFTEKNNPAPAKENMEAVHTTINYAELVYNDLHLATIGLSENAFEYAYKGYQYLLKKEKLNNPGVLSICDLSQSSGKKRFYILDLANEKVLMTSYVAHGKGSGSEYATHFSNKANSHQSSLGFYVTGSTYYGEHGLSLKLKGLETGFNDHAVNRNIVVHGAGYIGNNYLDGNKVMGRSYGCPAVPQKESGEIINLIKDGTCLFVYHPTKTYLHKSKILND